MAHEANRYAPVVAACLLLSACEVGPDYQKPAAASPPAYKESSEAAVKTEGWKPAEPKDAANRGAWWSIYSDPVLDGIESQVEISNQNLKASEAAFRQARALVSEARAGYFPVLGANASVQRSGQGGGSSSGGRTSASRAQTQYDLTATASWDLDLWGRIRRGVESNEASAQASAADLASARLSFEAELASDYFSLRIDDEQMRLLNATVEAFQKSLEITQNRYRAGVAAKSDVAQAQTQVETTRAQAIAVGVQRAQLEHAIAVLIGKPPAEFSIAPEPFKSGVPEVPAGVPSTLLERRPDIAAAERRVAAANAQIGVAIAAYYPDLTLSASYGFAGPVLGTLVQASNAVWALGPQLAETIFNGGLREAQVEAAKAAYDQTVADYRQTVLSGFQQVEDELSNLRILAQQAQVQEGAVKAAEESERLTLNDYKAGTVAYTSVVTAQATALSNKQSLLTIQQTRLAANVALIQALGGGWTAVDLPAGDQLKGDNGESTKAKTP
jgi:NodT family efflux transporter outer membrane factor (OMF) lipoprotein